MSRQNYRLAECCYYCRYYSSKYESCFVDANIETGPHEVNPNFICDAYEDDTNEPQEGA